ncbi:DUF1707 SHOCT-like domain-containing protein [Micromonospora yangpuensis]|uniref:DUF1707 domain-containing protein n=1 Tax=Micromonospora yangpuensis TaxID=683228 RepID=A0A1C6UTZ2_9ACTN|nr:DUF1707 domain-containing protein [Micromonospora yangpuensis]GGM24471.1 hypothetical protein GCM10012279_48540 [Micromonospora yangpuensis]SCL57507.1 protein of unknown function [Micromonospora yangpuensis]
MNLKERVGTAQRNQVLDLLSQALEQGYLDLAEYESRISAVHGALFVGDLTSQVADLPRQLRWYPYPVPVAPVALRPATDSDLRARPWAIVSVVLGGASLFFALCWGIGGILGVAAILLGRPALKSPPNQTLAVIGILLGVAGLGLSLLSIVLFLLL